MKNRKLDFDHEKYRNLLAKMQNKKRQIIESTKQYNHVNSQHRKMPQHQRDNNVNNKYQVNDDLKIKNNTPKLEFTKNVAITSKNQKKNNQANNNNHFFKSKRHSEQQSNSVNWALKQMKKNLHTQTEKQRKSTQLLEQYQQETNQNQQYFQILSEKLDTIEKKISQMKNNLLQKKNQKQKLLEVLQKKKKLQISVQKNQKKQSGLKGLVTQVPEQRQLHAFQRNPYSPNHNIYYVSQIIRAYKQMNSLARQHVQTSIQIFRILQNTQVPSNQQMKKRQVNLVRRKGYEDKKTVVFDLDQTLIHCNQTTDVPYDVKLPIKFPTGEVIEAGINIRPYAAQILQQLSKNYEVIVFTASHSCYASVVLDHLDPKNQFIHHRLFREHCYATPQGIYIKDLRVINRDLSTMILIDNAAYSYFFQLQNGIPIIPYYHGSTDYELRTLQKYIESLLFVKDVRDVNKKIFKLQEYKNYQDPEQLVEQLYLNEEKLI